MMNNCINVSDETVSVAVSVNSDATPAQPEFVHLTETRRYIYRVIAAVDDESFSRLINRLLRQFEGAIREELESTQNSPLLCRKLARSIIGLTHLIHTLLVRRAPESSSCPSICERWCFIVANYIACELCAAQDRVENEQSIIERISSMLSLYIERSDVGSAVYKKNTLCTLIAVPKLFGQANIITVFYSRLFPQWSTAFSELSQAELPDKIYIEYIIIFYYWQRLERNGATKQRIFEFAIKFMRPRSTLPYNPAYIEHLPKYSDASTATRCILEYLSVKQCCRGLHSASRLDNRSLQPNELIVDSDEEDAASETSLLLVSVLISTQQQQQQSVPPPVPDPPDFLKRLCCNARRLEPEKRAAALHRGFDSTSEVVNLCQSDEEEEMFSLDFSVPANVDSDVGAEGDDDYVPTTRIYPSNLRTYQRVTSSATTIASPASDVAIYTIPRIVNSYSFRRDSLHIVSTTQVLPYHVDQCVQTAEEVEEEEEQEEQQQQQQQREQEQQQQMLSFDNNDAISSCMPYSETRPSDSTTATELIYEDSFTSRQSSQDSTQIELNDNHLHCHQPSSRNSHSSDASLQKKQVTFSAQHLPASSRSQSKQCITSMKPSIKRYKNANNTSPSSSMDYIESLKLMGRKEHLLAGQRMFSKLESKNICDKGTINSMSSSGRHARKAPLKKQTCSTITIARPTPKLTFTTMSTSPRTPIPTIQCTPTTSNASSGTPTPQLNRIQARGPQRSLPTPPASTHSSIDTCLRHPKSSEHLQHSADFQQVQALGRKYKFSRRKFTDSSPENVEFYNSLLKLQRSKLLAKRQSNAKVPPPKSELKLKKQLIAANIKVREDIERLEGEVELIKRHAVQTRADMIAAMSKVVVRLKRCHIEDFAMPRSSVEEDRNEVTTQLIRPKKAKVTRRRRHKPWTRKKHMNKETQLALVATSMSASATATAISPVPAAELAPIPVPATVSAAVPATVSATVPAKVPDPVPDLIPNPAPVPVPAPESASATSPAELDCIAAYVTLANNGECCTDDDTMAGPCSVVAAHEIVVASSNVPVYLLNGESRDVMTPVPASFANDAVATEP
ncbi:uncharacterized protein LOC6558736 [Drosophila grimshawi]|uniref:GH16893 n=1 Tax=Drosophila grimshawi TaxID=7222 RepID=B4IXK9_DROGR|nr:uncharacterized protein LOC6558736 [Drosophila grimshawi]EDV97471.1 GH16893 [Drosophila grimshawi]